MEFGIRSRDLGHPRTCAWGWVGQLEVGLGTMESWPGVLTWG